MAITIGYNPAAALIGQMAFQGGLGSYNQVQQALRQQADLDAARRRDDRWQLETQIANQQYLNAVNNQQAETQQLRGFQNTNYQQQQGILDAQQRARMGIEDAQLRQRVGIESDQFMQQRSLADAQQGRQMQQDLSRWSTEYGSWDARTRQAAQLDAERQQLQAQIADAQRRQQWSLAADLQRTMMTLNAQQQSQAAQQQFQGQLAQFNAQQDFARLGQQGQIQSLLSGQSYRQQLGLTGVGFQNDMAMQQLRGSQAQDLAGMELAGRADMQTNQFLMENMLGPYAGYADQISARAAYVQDQQYQQRIAALDDAVRSGMLAADSPAYHQARNQILSQRLGIQNSIGLGQELRQKAFEETLVKMTTADGNQIDVIRLPSGGVQALEDPMIYRNFQIENAQLENQRAMQRLAMESALKYVEADSRVDLATAYTTASAMLGDQSARAELERKKAQQAGAVPPAGNLLLQRTPSEVLSGQRPPVPSGTWSPSSAAGTLLPYPFGLAARAGLSSLGM